ncbi:hypothetical protein [Reichenbachiella ulvae]|uniref:Uncharacterized protein n=1 Tax=Reichenbachiella ulvae TaxID=2980104 RepID=A0ABT3CUY1_9BACT|nr:hypothetical protein [Reichenbachiella ulvae]MCV9387379.1 hypothetical protein [Reichenbachiella ulvae]
MRLHFIAMKLRSGGMGLHLVAMEDYLTAMGGYRVAMGTTPAGMRVYSPVLSHD